MRILFLGIILMCGDACAMDGASAGSKKQTNDEWAKELVSKAFARKKQQQEENEKKLIEWARQNSQKKQMSPEQKRESEIALAEWEHKIDILNRSNKKQ